MRNIFLEKSYIKYGGEASPYSFIKSQNWVYLCINSLKLYAVYFSVCPSRWLPKYVETKVLTICFCLFLKVFRKTKRGVELVSLSHFLHDFWRKLFLTLYFISWSSFPLLLEILNNMCIITISYPVCGLINFETNLSFLSKQFFIA